MDDLLQSAKGFEVHEVLDLKSEQDATKHGYITYEVVSNLFIYLLRKQQS